MILTDPGLLGLDKGTILYFFLFLITFFSSSLFGSSNEHCLVFVHIGDKFPKYLQYSMAQARLFNPESDLFLIGNFSAFNSIDTGALDIISITIESLTKTQHHEKFEREIKTKTFWRYTLERFLVLDDFIQQYQRKNVFHIENDVMIYLDLDCCSPIFQICYPNMMATVFDCDERSVPCFVYFENPTVSELLAQFIAERAHWNTTDMHLLSLFKDQYYKTRGDHLPNLIPSYAEDYPLTNIFKNTAKDPKPFCTHLESLKMIFDAAALGQFLGGIDPILGHSKPGFLGEASIFLPMFFQFQWAQDKEKRWIPYISYKEKIYPIANLHIHCKDLAPFGSLNEEPPAIPTECFSSLPFNHIQPKSSP